MKGLEKEAYVFGMIFMLSNKLQILGDKMDPNLTVKQWLFLAGVLKCESSAPTLSEVAAKIGSSRQNVKKIASILEKQDFVLLEKDEADARMLHIKLTDRCMEHLRRRDETERLFLHEIFKGFEEVEMSHFCDSIKKLEVNLIKIEQRDRSEFD